MRNWRVCNFESETFDLEDLKMILDMASPDRSFASNAKEFPTDFRHENALKFENMYYKDAGWVKMEDLYALKNCRDVVLGRTMFTQPEIKAFINHWVNSEFDMFWLLDVFTEKDFDTVDILDGLTLLHIEQADLVCLTMAKATETRMKTFLCFSNTENSLLLTAWAPGEFISGEGDKFDTAIRNREGVIELLIEKKQLEMELESADEENNTNTINYLYLLNVLALIPSSLYCYFVLGFFKCVSIPMRVENGAETVLNVLFILNTLL
ncbi:unnamed protein product [Caenorhabditis brenneri]